MSVVLSSSLYMPMHISRQLRQIVEPDGLDMRGPTFSAGCPQKEHLVLLDDVEKIIFKVKEDQVNSMAVQLAQQHKQLYKFEH